MTARYIRQYKASILTWRGDTIEIVDPHFTFRVEKNITRIYQFAELTIHNLSADTETDIFKNGKELTIEAGYEDGPYGVIFKGPIRQPIRGKEDGVTYFIRLVCLDGDDALNFGFSNFVLTNGQTAANIATQVCRNSTIPFDLATNPSLGAMATTRGKVVFGNPGDHLRSIAQDNNSMFYVDDGIAKISPLSIGPPPVVPEINATTGMIGIPYQVDQGIQVKILIDPTVRLDTWFKLNNQGVVQAQLELGQLQTLLDLDGLYRVIEIVATGDTRGQDWYFDITAISQHGPLPAMLVNPNQTGV